MRRSHIQAFKFLLLLNLIIARLGTLNETSCMSVDHCYSDIGCFPLSEEFYHPRHRPFNVRPWHRSRIKTHFELFSRSGHPEGYVLRPWDRVNLRESNFNPLLETKIIIPGWLDNIKRAYWVRELRDALLWKWKPVNIILVHWRNFTPYTIATANTRVVGAELANLLKSIEAELGYNRAYYHLIGHSLGAHIGGYCGDRIPGLGRITALDPARPFFQHMPKSVRLDRADAKFVDAIHSDFTPENAILLLMSFGMTTPVGHIDFYPNGPPLLQPGCLRDVFLAANNGIERGMRHNSLPMVFLETVRYITACDHQRSHEWFIESITNRQCLFVGVRCNTFEGMINGRCTCDDSASSCAIMGIHADQMYINNVHQDIWPKDKLIRPPRRPIRQNWPAFNSTSPELWPPVAMTPWQMLTSPPSPSLPIELLAELQSIPQDEHFLSKLPFSGQPMTKEHILHELRKQASKLRYPTEPQMVASSNSKQIHHEDLFVADSNIVDYLTSVQDTVFMEYLKNIATTSPLSRPESRVLKRSKENPLDLKRMPRKDTSRGTREKVDARINKRSSDNSDGHPDLLSDIDRDIELWYEDESRWYLKTNNRPDYCVNQYQVLVYLGGLQTSNGHPHLKANLLISIIGSRGQLINQRFKPRSAKLDANTMQPFFIILEGSYSLGSIKSIAISWEARNDPDPVQATVSFQSNSAIEAIQSFWPTYKAKHPFLSETLKYDYSSAFMRHQPHRRPPMSTYSWPVSGLRRLKRFQSNIVQASDQINHSGGIERRSNLPVANEPTLVCASKANSENKNEPSCEPEMASLNQKESVDFEEFLEPLEANQNQDLDYEESIVLGDSDYGPILTETQIENPSVYQRNRVPNLRGPPVEQSLLPVPKIRLSFPTSELTDEFLDHLFTSKHSPVAKLNNIGLDLDRDLEDSVIINRIWISPLMANYGKDGAKVGRTFCPPHPGFRLRREQTVRLSQSLLTNLCHFGHGRYPNRHSAPHGRPAMFAVT